MMVTETSPLVSSSLMDHTNATTSPANHTETPFDPFCTGMLEGTLVWAVISVPCSLVGVIASAWVLSLLLHDLRDIYMINLTAMDLIFNVSVLPAALCFFLWRNEVFLKINDFIYCLSVSGRPLFMVCICVDCFMAVLHPITYRNLTRSRYRQVVCMPVWGFTLVYGLMFIFNPQLFITPYMIVPYILSLPAITFCNLSILHALRKQDPSGKTDVHPQKQRALHTITNSFVMAVVSYLPPLVVNVLMPVLPLTEQQSYCQVGTPFLVGTTLGGTIQPLLYLSHRGHLKNLWGRCGGAPASS
ncbi:G-protein coupled receptor 183-like [Engraulis encrasicolus]|uniref:G-protein coupled receptor 183-like n=1 Tax=Engraulis encrasicolus TaxID=184585 RepID=UPI002FD626E6